MIKWNLVIDVVPVDRIHRVESTYRKYISNCPNSNGWPRRMTTSLKVHMADKCKYSLQNVLNTATMSDGLLDFA